MGLDFVLVHQQHHYLATEAEKLDYFAGKLGLISHLSRVSTDRGTARNTSTRYFADKSPLFLSGASRAPRPVVAFCYVDGTTGKPLGLDTYLLQYRDLFSRLDGFKIIFVAADERRFPKVERIFRRLCGSTGDALCVARDPDIERLHEHFRTRHLLGASGEEFSIKQGWTACEKKLAEFRGPEYDALYRQW